MLIQNMSENTFTASAIRKQWSQAKQHLLVWQQAYCGGGGRSFGKIHLLSAALEAIWGLRSVVSHSP